MRNLLYVITLLLCSTAPAFAGPLASPTMPVILSVSGAVDHLNAPERTDFDLPMLEALPQHSLDTTTPWTEGMHHYQGVWLSELLETLHASGTQIVASALNDYHATLDVKELAPYPVLIALKQDGHYMRVRDKGPLWIVYPLSEYRELDNPKYHAGMVWQLRALEIH